MPPRDPEETGIERLLCLDDSADALLTSWSAGIVDELGSAPADPIGKEIRGTLVPC